jgi:signal transduction histidine kinase
VLANLISNAVKYSLPGGKIELQVSRTQQLIRVSVTDHGEGIPEAFRAHIFEKFAQANWTATNPKGGSGLGLNISRAIIEHHGGVLSFHTELAAGSTFYFELPVL